jgi:hypothetical protein
MNAIDLYIGRLELQNILLVQALHAAKTRIAQDRCDLYQCHYDPAARDVVDELGMAGLAEYDEVLRTVQRAIDATVSDFTFPGLVYFSYHHPHGWRVTRAEWNVLPPAAFRAGRESGTLMVQGHFKRLLRPGTYCKRPHKEIAHA